jgi:CBS domain containing-hemolysin-like protein
MERLDDGRIRVAGSMTIDDADEELGRRPRPEETVTVAGIDIEAEAIDGLRIASLLVSLPPPPPDIG